MLTILVGKVPQFDSKTKKLSTYVARLEQYLIANNVRDATKLPLLVTLVVDETFELMVDSCSPEIPEDNT